MSDLKKIKELEDLVNKIELVRDGKNNMGGIYMISIEESPILIRGIKELIADWKTFLNICKRYKKAFNKLLNQIEKNKDFIEEEMDETSIQLF